MRRGEDHEAGIDDAVRAFNEWPGNVPVNRRDQTWRWMSEAIAAYLSGCPDPIQLGDHMPRRGDDVETWLKRRRDDYRQDTPRWLALDRALDRYRACADYGLTLRPEDEEAGDP